ncbi:S1C family serine protease [Planktothrix pseudagardhii]|uniref:Serine protease do-like n=1 Tax=Planktothrix pseudagardhii TaxID=132604 RepID=A0A9W4CVY6_9CYAN|nr:trypsin-like peptidase domain-containing protein [Planktothrix pseudagardhii]CAD5927653.1 putative serine protease do-like [Planktothrix pseudagardhii]
MKGKSLIVTSVFSVVTISLCACSEAQAARLEPIVATNFPPLLVQNRPTIPESTIASDSEQVGIQVYQRALPAFVTINAGSSSGSGTIVRADGLVLTNEHVVRGAGRGIVIVVTNNSDRYRGRVLATDVANDLALIQLKTNNRFPVVPLADASGIQVGQRVYAIGSPFGLSGTLTTGILSRIGRNGDLQTDANLNPGNSGGPLLNSQGQLIGVNKAILSPDGRSNSGIGFATSAPIARQFIQQVISAVSLPQSGSSPRLGVNIDRETLVIESVEPGSVAARAGLRRGDRLVAVNGRRLREIDQLLRFLNSRPTPAVLTVDRNRQLGEVRINF